mmetsp:Transcript_21854/g.21018  ORF Transcript_21854/g.21018 Transcript_21854/m.21018 type:complete len:247 (-) Transcript_21854:3684-4424(-)
MGVPDLRGDEQLEVRVDLHHVPEQVHTHRPSLHHILFEEDGVEDEFYFLADVFDEDGAAELHGELEGVDEVDVVEVEHLDLLRLVLDPLVRLVLRIDAHTLPPTLLQNYPIAHRKTVTRQPIEVPLFDLDGVAEDFVEVVVVAEADPEVANEHLPLLLQLLPELLRERTQVHDVPRTQQDVSLDSQELFGDHSVADQPLLFFSSEPIEEFGGPFLLQGTLIYELLELPDLQFLHLMFFLELDHIEL